MSSLAVQLEYTPALAEWLGVQKLAMVREDLLPDGGGKKRRALERFAEQHRRTGHIHLLSYAGSHTAYTLSQLLPAATIHLYGTDYGGGAYQTAMVARLENLTNILQRIGSTWEMTRLFRKTRKQRLPNHFFMNIGGSLGADPVTQTAVARVVTHLGAEFQHVVAVASGDLLTAIARETTQVSGILTQPLAIRLVKSLSLAHTQGLYRASLLTRAALMHEISEITGNLWDPIFMGAVFSYLKRQRDLPGKICIWVTCPRNIAWSGDENAQLRQKSVVKIARNDQISRRPSSISADKSHFSGAEKTEKLSKGPT